MMTSALLSGLPHSPTSSQNQQFQSSPPNANFLVPRPPPPSPADDLVGRQENNLTIVEGTRIDESNKLTSVRYLQGRLLGKGGFARCYELTDIATKIFYAGKIVSKKTIVNPRARAKLMSEIKIHQSLCHENIVRFHHFFEDKENVNIILELCEGESLMELMRNRKRLTEDLARRYLLQIVNAVKYMHSRRIIHRDLKLGNLFITATNDIKIGDFGLATTVDYEGERKKTLCGTPNYIAPEVLNGQCGHSYEVDIWSVGVILYTMLVGRPPFETMDVKSTYTKIKANQYEFPSDISISVAARSLICSILVGEPSARPSLDKILQHPFINKDAPIIPSNCFMKSNSIDESENNIRFSYPPSNPNAICVPGSSSNRMPLSEVSYSRNQSVKLTPFNNMSDKSKVHVESSKLMPEVSPYKPATSIVHKASTKRKNDDEQVSEKGKRTPIPFEYDPENAEFRSCASIHHPNDNGLENMALSISQINLRSSSLAEKISQINSLRGIWVSRWVDYSHKYGIGYIMSNGNVGAYFNDSSKIIVNITTNMATYTPRPRDREGISEEESKITFLLSSPLPDVMKKVTLLKHFQEYLQSRNQHGFLPFASNVSETLGVSTNQNCVALIKNDNNHYVKRSFRTRHAFVFRLSNRYVQVNFFDHSTLILSNDAKHVTYISKDREVLECPVENILTGVPSSQIGAIERRLRYAKEILTQLTQGVGCNILKNIDIDEPQLHN